MALHPAPTIVFRTANLDDRDAILRLIEAMGGHDGVSALTSVGWVYGSILQDPEIRPLVAVISDAVVGYAELHARPALLHGVREAWLAVLAVDPMRRGEGIGTALMRAVDLEAAHLGCDRISLESSNWRSQAQSFYQANGFVAATPAVRLTRPVQGPHRHGLVNAFLDAAARGTAAASGAIAGLRDRPNQGIGADGAVTLAADLAAEQAIIEHLEPLGITIVSEESGTLVRPWADDRPWISLDPLDGSRNYRNGLPPWASSIGLIVEGQPVAGFVLDHTSCRRWWASAGQGAWVDGRPARPAPGRLVAMPSIGMGEESHLRLPAGFDRVRMSGSTCIDLCRVADGSLGGFLDSIRAVVHPHDLAGPMAILLEAGAAVARVDRRPITIEPEPASTMPIAAAADEAWLEVILTGC